MNRLNVYISITLHNYKEVIYLIQKFILIVLTRNTKCKHFSEQSVVFEHTTAGWKARKKLAKPVCVIVSKMCHEPLHRF